MDKNYIAKCGNGHVMRGDSQTVNRNGGWLHCPCGKAGIAKGMKITINDKPCGERCTGAVGPACSCSCKGENHGDGRAFL